MTMLSSQRAVDITLLGSSIFEFWGNPKWGDLLISNNAIRSTTSEYWLEHDFSDLPNTEHILIYCGSNDLIFGNKPEQIIANILSLISTLSEQFPTTYIGFFSILKCPQKQAENQLEIIEHINQQIRLKSSEHFRYFEFNDAICNDPKWFVGDGLHLTTEAYMMLNRFYEPVIQNWVQHSKKDQNENI